MKKNAKNFIYIGLILLTCGFIINQIPNITLTSTLYNSKNKFFNAGEEKRGETRNDTVSVGELQNDGDVKLEKKVTPSSEEGTFDVSLTVKGKNVKTPIYVAVVFDKSGSMICNNGAVPFLTGALTHHYQAADGQYLSCSLGSNHVTKDKWEKAIAGTKLFTDDILKENPDSRISLITFATTDSLAVGWTNQSLQDADFGHPYGLTALGEALNTAIRQFDNVREDAHKVILIVGDGIPTNENTARNHAEDAKNADITVYAFGSHLDEEQGAKELFQQLVSSNADEHLFDTDSNNIETEAKKLASTLTNHVAGGRATINDTIANGFSYVPNSANKEPTINDNTLTFKAANITETGTTFTYQVKIDKDLKDGWYPVSNKTNITYVDDSGISQTKELENEPEIYWIQEKYKYSINYYKDDISQLNLLGSIDDSAHINTQIKQEDIDINKFKPFGYQDGVISTNMPYIVIDGNNIINVIYQKRNDLTYKVKYIEKETGNILEEIIKENNTYNSTITEVAKTIKGYNVILDSTQDIIIDQDNKEITFYYEKKHDLIYTINYYKDDTTDLIGQVEIRNVTYLDEISIEDININKFKPNDNYQDGTIITEMPLIIDDGENTIDIVYKRQKPIPNEIISPKTGDNLIKYITMLILSSIIIIILIYLIRKKRFSK